MLIYGWEVPTNFTKIEPSRSDIKIKCLRILKKLITWLCRPGSPLPKSMSPEVGGLPLEWGQNDYLMCKKLSSFLELKLNKNDCILYRKKIKPSTKILKFMSPIIEIWIKGGAKTLTECIEYKKKLGFVMQGVAKMVILC